ncbi:MAG: c-type cytochrome [Deltaproteobacteria bacterium]
MRRLICLLLVAGCGGERTDATPTLMERGRAYVASMSAGRQALEASIVDPTNGYSARRLERYREDVWGALDEWRPRVRTPGATTWDDDTWDAALDEASLLALGERAFFAYPVQLADALGKADVEDYGVWPGSYVEVDLGDGVFPAFTCATCHARPDAAGVPNHRLDLGRLYDDFYGTQTEQSAWGLGALDVTADGVDNPTAIPDLRPIQHQTHLHRAATLKNDPVALAVRLETLLLTSVSEARRPPRVVAFALALYLWRMADTLPVWTSNATFDAQCATCHGTDGRPNAPRPIEEIGTPDAVARSPARTTGTWRVPSLLGVGQRERLLSMGRVEGLEELLDPERSVPGHRFGLELSPAERDALITFLRER